MTASSPSTFMLDGAKVSNAQGVPNWPVLTGQTVKAGKEPVTISFSDGSTITMDPGAEARVDLSGKVPIFKLVKGTAKYALKTASSVRVVSGVQEAAHTGLIVAGATIAGAAGAGVGVSRATSGGSSVSPSH